jgi:mercuric ion binding protein
VNEAIHDCCAMPTRVDGVGHAAVSYEKKTATVTFDDAKTTLAALTAATTKAGYPSRVAER